VSDTLQYHGYDGSVLFSAEDRMLHRRILDIRDMVSYGGTGIEDLEANFHAAVDEYLAFCKETVKTPDMPSKAPSTSASGARPSPPRRSPCRGPQD